MSWKYLTARRDLLPFDIRAHFDRGDIDTRRVATGRIVPELCQVPSSVKPGQVFRMTFVYQFGERLDRCTGLHHSGGSIACPPMEEWPDYHGGFRYGLRGLYPMTSEHKFWIWKLQRLNAYHDGNLVRWVESTWPPNQQFSYIWEGTIEELAGKEFTEPTTVLTNFQLTGVIDGWGDGHETWPFSWPLKVEWSQEAPWDAAEFAIDVDIEVPPDPPYPLFDLDYCSISKSTVAPNEQFHINIRAVNQNEHAGNFSVGVFCEGKYQVLAESTISGHGTRNLSIPVTANQLAQRTITSSQYLSFSVTLNNEDGETDRWTPAAIAVIVPVNGAGTLSGRVTDKTTGAGLAGVAVTTSGYAATTGSGGHYSIADMTPGTYTIRFTRSGYWEETRDKAIAEGSNTLNVAMTPTTEPLPDEREFPWGLAIGGAAMLAALAVLAQRRKGEAR